MLPPVPARPANFELLTPADWQVEALQHASKNSGTAEGARALVEARRYAEMDALLRYAQELETQNMQLRLSLAPGRSA